jgi:hypothetical protein
MYAHCVRLPKGEYNESSEVFYDSLKTLHDQHWEYMNRRPEANLESCSNPSQIFSNYMYEAPGLYIETGLPAQWRRNLADISLALMRNQKSDLSFEWFQATLTSNPPNRAHKTKDDSIMRWVCRVLHISDVFRKAIYKRPGKHDR